MAEVYDDKWVDVGGTRLHYLHAGGEHDATPVVLLHGGIIDAAALSWGGAIGPLAADRPVYALDFAGFGESDDPDRTPTTGYHVDTLRAFLDRLGLDRAHLVGLSLGGGVAIGTALDYPEHVAALVPVASFGLGRELPSGKATWLAARLGVLNRLNVALLRRSRGYAEAALASLVHDADALPAGLVEEFQELCRRPNAGAAFRQWRDYEVTLSGWRTCYLDRLGQVGSPTLFVHGTRDEVVPPEWSRRAADRVPDADATFFEECGHWVPRERPEALVDEIREFLPR